MGHTAAVIRPHIEPGRRVLAVSDIHGNLAFLKGVLKKAGFSRDDVLILVGDLLEKGRDSLATLRYVMGLREEYTVYPLCGNCDYIDRMFLEGQPVGNPAFSANNTLLQGGAPDVDQELWPVLDVWRERSTLFQMALEAGLPLPRRAGELPALRAALLERFPREAAFLMGLPHILEAGNFIFVHGGVPREDRLEELDAYSCMKNDDFLGQGLSFQKWVVVGHWPVTLYNPHIQSAAPLICRERHIVSIDGGCVLKVDGQLNALIIPDINGDGMDFTAYDDLKQVTALDGQEASGDPLNIRWSDSVVEPLEERGDCVLARHPSSGRTLWLPRDFLVTRRDGRLHTEDATDYRLPVSPGDRLSVVRETRRGLLVKKDSVTGWYFGRAEPAPDPKN
ncbi:MAG: metallophosphoesterase [Oscillospiraceae bacterium]|nr:metallophosphoesterase [Oscillospiraceae bacterium]